MYHENILLKSEKNGWDQMAKNHMAGVLRLRWKRVWPFPDFFVDVNEFCTEQHDAALKQETIN